jgi:hypothetical protein
MVAASERRNQPPKKEKMESAGKENIDRVVHALQEDLSVLQIKVGALESLLLHSDEIRAKYTSLVSEQTEALMRERQRKPD